MNQYDVSVIIPVYNGEEYIESCIESICKQDYARMDRIQIIIINDGSKDDSLKICKAIIEKETTVKINLINSENQGVSAARNKGMKKAKGKYIMFLDSDDFITEDTISKLVSFFDNHYDEIDLATYPMYEYKEGVKKKKILQRYEDYFDTTRVYDLKTEYQAIQPTMNIIMKNYFDENLLFEENVSFNEDTLFNTQVLMKKQKIGYVKEAKYMYRIHESSTTNTRQNNLFSFEQYMYVFEKLFSMYKDENNKVPKYIQRLYLNVIRYRINQDELLPYHLKGEEYKKACDRIKSLVEQIENQTIIEFNQMDKYHKAYLIKLKNEDSNIIKRYDGQAYTVNDMENILFTEDNIEIVINKLKIKKDKIYILGYLKSILLDFIEPSLIISYKKKDNTIVEKNVKLSNDTIANRYKTNMSIANFYKFEIDKDISNISEIKFKAYIEDKEIITRYVFNQWVQMSGRIKNYKVYFGDYRVQFKKGTNTFYISKPKEETRKKDFKRKFKKFLKISERVVLYRVIALKTRKKNKKIWLYYDRVNVFDNGYIQFKHDIKINDEIEKYYILDGKKNKFRDKFTFKERKNVVKFGSFKHKILFLNSDKIITSFSSLGEYCPFLKNYLYYKDILKYDLIYLQHGVLHAKLLKMYGKEFAPIDKFVISSQFEKDNLINNYGYSKKDLICTGMPRFDEKVEVTEPENRIIFAPSWRQYLIGKLENRHRDLDVDKFLKSKYYIETMDFLKNKRLLNLLKEKNIILDYKLHPIFEPYVNYFKKAECNNITVSIGNTDLNKCKAFITDFSSFQFDFVRLARPIIYFVPDIDEFNAGLHNYRELDLKYEDAFGRLCLTGDELVDEIIKTVNNNFEAEAIYKERMEKFFFNIKYRKDRLYDILKEN